MAITQISFRGRDDSEPLYSASFSHDVDTSWTQQAGDVFRVRFALSGSGTVGGTLEASTNGTSFFSVSDTSGTVQAARSAMFADGEATTYLLSASSGFVSGAADELDGAVPSVALSSQHTEVEYAVTLVPADVTAGGTITLRVAGADTYSRKPALTVHLAALDRVRMKVGDTDVSDQLLTDAQVNACIADWPNNLDLAAAAAAEAIAAKFSRGFNFTTERQQFNRSERVNHYTQLAASLRRRGGALAST